MMVFPLSKVPGYPEDAKPTETANPRRVVIATKFNIRSTQGYTRSKRGVNRVRIAHQNDRSQIGVLAE
jgi:hypothetical protein